ncbi:hypothetical protein N7G274_001824 [Stereocaulon virgatum]|uniref:Kelch repeat protein n=1 Tax=Stereocaulon virgatum TaxID=373712 RepID=A0ABR4AKT6_9LECA
MSWFAKNLPRFVFGGSTNDTFDLLHAGDAGCLDVFILSMPSFVWFKAGTTTQVRRANHFCQVIGQGQMLVIGGHNPAPEGFLDGVDPWTRGMNIFDMNSLNWTGAYNPGIIYDRPPVVQQYYTNRYISVYIF